MNTYMSEHLIIGVLINILGKYRKGLNWQFELMLKKCYYLFEDVCQNLGNCGKPL